MRRTAAPFVIAAVKTAISVALLWAGFRSISDDDFARVTIAQRFVLHPHWDPSGTSWLPLPFWVYGAVMKVFGEGLATAQMTALFIGVYAAVGVWAVARSASLTPRAALIGGLIAACIPHAAHYGVAMVPDYPTAVLALAALATLSRLDGPTRAIGGLAACLATLCRYETWPIAAMVAGYAWFDARRERNLRPWLLAGGLLAPLGACAWMLHGLVEHRDPLFFVKRVAAYRQALGGDASPLLVRLCRQPWSLLSAEPELVLLAAGLALVLLASKRRLAPWLLWRRPAVVLASLVAFLMVGDFLDGAPTHHEERTLLVVWLCLALFVGEQLDHLTRWQGSTSWRDWRPSVAALCVAVGLGLGLIATTYYRIVVARPEPFVDRSSEIQIGLVAKKLVPANARLAVYTDDYGYFAVQAAFARPDDVAPLLRRDPRQRELDPISNPEELSRRLDALRTKYLVVPARARNSLGLPAQLLAESGAFALMQLL